MDKTTMPEAFRPGPPVEHVVAKNTDDAMNQMVEQVKLLMNALNYAEDGSAYDQETFMTQQFNMVYVVLTRAMEMLYVYTVKGSEYEPFSRLK